jgi:hypothetical protein
MQALGIISYQSFQDDFDILVNRIPHEVIEERHKKIDEELQAKLRVKLATVDEHRKLPDEVVKLLRREQ